MIFKDSRKKAGSNLPILDLPDEFVPPDYGGGSLANIPGTIAVLLDAPFEGLPPLRAELRDLLGGRAKRIILVLLDSFGWYLVRQERERLAWLQEKAQVFDQITSVFPSTTVSALSSVWTGFAPAQHGLPGLYLFFHEHATLGQFLDFSPTVVRVPGSLEDAGISPEEFLQVPGLAEQLRRSNIPTYSFKSYTFVNSGLSRMHDRGVEKQIAIISSPDMFNQVRELMEETKGKSVYVYAYWHAIDTISHNRGPHHPSVAAELHAVLHQLKSILIDRLTQEARKDTVLLITGDHGQVRVSRADCVVIDRDRPLSEMLLMRPTGEPRVPYLFARQGQKRALYDYLRNHLPDAGWAIDANEALSSGLMGPEPHAGNVSRYLGDVLFPMRGNHLLITTAEEARVDRMQGRHGGMTADEMQIPWIGMRLDD